MDDKVGRVAVKGDGRAEAGSTGYKVTVPAMEQLAQLEAEGSSSTQV